MNIDTNKIEANWKTYEKLCKRLGDANLDTLVETIGERLVMCPASPRLDQYNCEPGGLIQHLLDTTLTMKKLNKSLCMNLSMTSILKVGLLHDIGKVGDKDNDYFITQDSDWHREKLGQHYKYNENLQKMSITHRTLFLLQMFGVSLSEEEWIAIQISSGSHFEENRFYVGSEPSLAMLLQHSKSIAIHMTT
tara:strand:- start:20 stop:595 length:576 start_codon:yes stop_codon:yes gene_type:complete